MKPIVLSFFFLFYFNLIFATGKSEFYDVFKGDSSEKVDELLQKYESIENPSLDISFYIGALYIKKSNYGSTMRKNIDTFKRGRDIIEDIINKNINNIEYRFIRLIIQEQIPSVLKYDNNRDVDSKIIVENLASIDDDLMFEIKDYSKISETLNIN